MQMETGWKPMPVIIKIFWIIMIVDAFFAIFSIFSVYSAGFDLVGIPFYGLPAVNIVFFLNLVLPILLIIGIYKRYRFVWIAIAVYFVFVAVNSLMTIPLIDTKIAQFAEGMSDTIGQMGEALFYQTMHLAILFSLILSAGFNLAITIIFLVKRNYFMKAKEISETNNDQELLS